jgi:hypothetical protein
MATVKRHRRTSNRQLTAYKRHELLTGEIIYAASGYSGYGDKTSTNLADFISDEMRADWEAHRDELLAFWESGQYTTAEVFPDSKPWMFVCGSQDTLPWAERTLNPSFRAAAKEVV